MTISINPKGDMALNFGEVSTRLNTYLNGVSSIELEMVGTHF
jgi:hypothetical protein